MTFNFSAAFRPVNAGLAPLMNLRRLLPQPVKLVYQITKGNLRDLGDGSFLKIAKPSRSRLPMPFTLEISQPVLPNAWQQNKLHNFRVAAHRVNAVVLQSGQVFSFWKTIGKPTEGKGYKKGRNLVGGQVTETFGGGLCQLSGILYHTSLLAGLTIVERHNHSVDLYANGEARFTPLGADATVAFGYKDLRVGNPFDFAVRFEVEVVEETLVCRLRSEKPLTALEIDFQVNKKQGLTEVLTSRRASNGQLRPLCKSVYRVG